MHTLLDISWQAENGGLGEKRLGKKERVETKEGDFRSYHPIIPGLQKRIELSNTLPTYVAT